MPGRLRRQIAELEEMGAEYWRDVRPLVCALAAELRRESGDKPKPRQTGASEEHMNQETTTPKRPARVIVAGYGKHYERPRVKPVKPMPRIDPPKPPTDSANWQATPDGKKELTND